MKQLPREITNYEKIKYLLEMGVYKGVEVFADSGSVFVFTELDGYYLFDILSKERISDEYVNSLDITSITPIPNPPKLLPVGTKVRVFEEYEDKYGTMSGLYIVYEQLDGQYALLGVDDGQSYVVPARAVYPVFEE